MNKPREYRNNNASEAVDVSKIRKATKGFYVRILGEYVFVDTTDARDYNIKLKVVNAPASEHTHAHARLYLVFSDGSEGDLGYIMNLSGHGKPFGEPGMEWVMYEHMGEHINGTRQHQAPTLEALMKYLQRQHNFTSAQIDKDII